MYWISISHETFENHSILNDLFKREIKLTFTIENSNPNQSIKYELFHES